jgi:hypothetical protein
VGIASSAARALRTANIPATAAITSTARIAKRDVDIDWPPPEDAFIRAFSFRSRLKWADK